MKTMFKAVSLIMLLCSITVAAPAAENLITTARGAQYKDLKVGAGESAQAGDVATMHFIGWIDNNGMKGKALYNTRREGKPVSFVIGTEKIMQGWNEGVIGMKPGGKRLLMVPPSLGYGAKGVQGTVPPNASLIFVIELVGLEPSH